MSRGKEQPRRAEKSRNLRYKRCAIESLEYETILNELEEITGECSEVAYHVGDSWELVEGVIGDEDEADEFRMLFPELSADADRLWENLMECANMDEKYGIRFEDCTVALFGDSIRYQMSVEYWDELYMDYETLTYHDAHIAISEAGQRLMKLTKAQMLETMAMTFRVVVGYLDIRQRYDYLKASMDILKGDNGATMSTIRQINEVYEEAAAVGFSIIAEPTKRYDKLLSLLPQKMFLE